MKRVIIGKNKVNYLGGGFEMRIETTSSNTVFTLPGRTGYTYTATVYWGDGFSSDITAYNDADLAHTYVTAGTYQISIIGTFDTIYFNNGGSKALVKKILSWGGDNFDGFTIMDSSFFGCSGLNELPTGNVKQRTAIATYSQCFYGCTSLTTIPTDIFRYNTSVTNFTSCFRGCTSLTTIPTDIFRYNTAVTNFSTCFYGCTVLATIPSDIFIYNTAVTNYSYSFYNCNKITVKNDMFNTANFLNKSVNWTSFVYRGSFTGTQGTMQDIWNADYGTGTPNLGTGATTRPFGGAGNSTTSISNYNDIPTGWKA